MGNLIEYFRPGQEKLVSASEFRRALKDMFDGDETNPDYKNEVDGLERAERLGAKFVWVRIVGGDVRVHYVSNFTLTPVGDGTVQ